MIVSGVTVSHLVFRGVRMEYAKRRSCISRGWVMRLVKHVLDVVRYIVLLAAI